MRLAQDAGLHDAVTDRVSLPTDKGVLDPDPVHQRRRPSRAPSPDRSPAPTRTPALASSVRQPVHRRPGHTRL